MLMGARSERIAYGRSSIAQRIPGFARQRSRMASWSSLNTVLIAHRSSLIAGDTDRGSPRPPRHVAPRTSTPSSRLCPPSGARDIGTPDVCGDGIRRQDLEVRPRGVEPQSGDTEVAGRPAAADGRLQLVERVIGVRGAGRQEDLEGHAAGGRRGERVTEERQTGAVDERRDEAQRAPCLDDELHERLARRATQPWRQRSTSGQRCDQIPGLADGDRAAAEHPRSALLACRGDALAVPSEPCSEDPDQFGVESGSRRCGAVREGRQQEACEVSWAEPWDRRAHEDATDQLGVVHVSQPRTGSRADRTTRSGRGND